MNIINILLLILIILITLFIIIKINNIYYFNKNNLIKIKKISHVRCKACENRFKNNI
mgnify:CR=1 FL=1